jgi:hypothetical protein
MKMIRVLELKHVVVEIELKTSNLFFIQNIC